MSTNMSDLIGVNTHMDFDWTAYGNVPRVIKCLQYLGIKHVRDSASMASSINAWKQVAAATGVKFNAYIGEGSPDFTTGSIAFLPALAAAGLLESIEGMNEADNAYSIQQGNSLANAVKTQQQVYAMGKQLKLPVINISFGAGWDKTNGDYDQAGDLTAYCDYANGHTYPGVTGDPAKTVDWVNSLTQFAAKKPVITTEIGWYTGSMAGGVTEQQQADKLVAALTECQKSGNVRTYIYELLDQKTGDANTENNFGLFHSDGTPKPAATAVRNLILGTAVAPAPVPAPAPAPTPVINADGSVTDAWAAKQSGLCTLNLLNVSGTLPQINALLAQCKMPMTVNIWNQGGQAATRDIAGKL